MSSRSPAAPRGSTALILAGGQGTRLAEAVPDLPKPMAPVAGRPFVEWLVEALARDGVRRIVFCSGHRASAIESHFGDGRRFGIDFLYSTETSPLGTGGALRLAASALPDQTLLALNGDSYCEFDAGRLMETHARLRARATLWTVPLPPEEPERYGTLSLDPEGWVTGFAEKSPTPAASRINAGIYVFDRAVLLALPEGRPVSLETEVLPHLVGSGLAGVAGGGPFIDIGTPDAYRRAVHFFASVTGAPRPLGVSAP